MQKRRKEISPKPSAIWTPKDYIITKRRGNVIQFVRVERTANIVIVMPKQSCLRWPSFASGASPLDRVRQAEQEWSRCDNFSGSGQAKHDGQYHRLGNTSIMEHHIQQR